MIQLFKHNFFNYFLLILLSVKIVDFVAEHITSTYEIEMCSEVDADDFENENDDKQEIDETETIHQMVNFDTFIQESTSKFKHILFIDHYITLYLEFSTPPPEFA